MEKSNLKGRILAETEKLISQSCSTGVSTEKFQALHQLIVKKHYNAAEVSIDYHRKRIALDIVVDDNMYNPRGLNVNLPTLHVNLLFQNLREFLNSCLETDKKSLAFYAWLLRSYSNKDVPLMAV